MLRCETRAAVRSLILYNLSLDAMARNDRTGIEQFFTLVSSAIAVHVLHVLDNDDLQNLHIVQKDCLINFIHAKKHDAVRGI